MRVFRFHAMRLLGRVCILAACAFFALVAPCRQSADAAPSRRATQPVTRPKPQNVDAYTITQHGDHYKVNISYPHLGVPAADAEISIWARDQAARFIESVQQIRNPLPMPYALTITHQTITTPPLVSVVFTIRTFMGGAHDEPGLATFVYNRRDGRRLTYKDLFLNTEGLVHALSSLCHASLSKNLGERTDQKMLKEGTAPEMANFDLFIVLESGIRVFFPPYQAAPLKEGYLNVDIPKNDLLKFGPNRQFWPKSRR